MLSNLFRVGLRTSIICRPGLTLSGSSSPARHQLENNVVSQVRHKFDWTQVVKENVRRSKKDIAWYGAAIAFGFFALSYAAVPLYRIYCQVTGKGGKAVAESEDKIKQLTKDKQRLLSVKFNADTASQMAWRFEPVQDQVNLYPGETTLAFYRAKNPLDEPVIGVATYSVLPYEAGQYLNKIQCFCFDEQMLSPNEDVFMPVFFYIDPKYVEDPRLEGIDELILSYTFFQSKDGGLYMPTIQQDHAQNKIPIPSASKNPSPNSPIVPIQGAKNPA